MREGRNVGEPTRSHTGGYDPSSKTPPVSLEVIPREKNKARANSIPSKHLKTNLISKSANVKAEDLRT